MSQAAQEVPSERHDENTGTVIRITTVAAFGREHAKDGLIVYVEAAGESIKGLKIAYSEDWGYAPVDPEVRRVVSEAVKVFETVAKPLTAGFATAPPVRLQAARVDGLFRSLADVFPPAGGAPGFTPLPGAGVLTRGTLAVTAGDTGGPRVRVYRKLRVGLSPKELSPTSQWTRSTLSKGSSSVASEWQGSRSISARLSRRSSTKWSSPARSSGASPKAAAPP